jgi:general secretion pathway protein G
MNMNMSMSIKRNIHDPKTRGFTLIEIMVVVVIIGILAVLIVPNIIGRVDDARIAKVKTDLSSLQTSLDMYRIDNGIYPSTDQGLSALVTRPQVPPEPLNWRQPYVKRLPKDPWGEFYQYRNPGTHGAVDIFSFGPSGKENGDEGVWIGNWSLD